MDKVIPASASDESKAMVVANMDGAYYRVVSRHEWGAMAPLSQERLQGPARKAVIHHTALWHCRGPKDCQDQLTYIQNMHIQKRGFSDIGYNFLIGEDGTVYEGRGWGVVGAHVKGNNHDSIGIAFMGNFNDESLSAAALSSARQLLQSGVSLGHLLPMYVLQGHRDLASTECPGTMLYEALKLLAQH
ncbi:hypothetical protein JZ751_002025 [Albula glossodonta]|uniref:Peptidoglycan-recognition protein n=1 Tax=Albula glossodonta TaxID=121402 RepID=A0A8T2P8R0_9TELE|nr:hypothetical protein JZ751_002025 [Albula glossodonta]